MYSPLEHYEHPQAFVELDDTLIPNENTPLDSLHTPSFFELCFGDIMEYYGMCNLGILEITLGQPYHKP